MKKLQRPTKNRGRLKNRSGQGLMEYLILVCLIAVAAISVVSAVGKNLKEQYANISNALQNQKAIKLTPVDKKAYGASGMDNFMEGAETRGE